MSTLTVPSGIFFGRTYASLLALKTQYDAAVDASLGAGALIGSSVNGQSFNFAGREFTLAEFGAELQQALAYLRPDLYPYNAPTDRSAARLV